MTDNLTHFINQHSIKTVNAELIKTGHCLSECAGDYYLHLKERGQPDGDVIRIFPSKTKAFDKASEMMKQYWKEH